MAAGAASVQGVKGGIRSSRVATQDAGRAAPFTENTRNRRSLRDADWRIPDQIRPGFSAMRTVTMKKYILFDHDGVLVETERWYYQANKRALEPLGIDLPRDAYLANMANGVSAWEEARVSGIPESEIKRGRELRNRYYQEYLMTEDIEIEGVLQTLAELADAYRMGIVTTSKRADFALIHRKAFHPGLHGVLSDRGGLRASQTTPRTLSDRTPTLRRCCRRDGGH